MIVDFQTATEELRLNGDICIVGAGPAGITLALELSKTGRSILLLEGGGLEFTEASQSLYAMPLANDIYPDPTTSRVRFFGGSSNHWEGSCRTFDPIDFERRSWVRYSGWPYSYDELRPYYERAFPYIQIPSAFTVDRKLANPLGKVGKSLRQAGFETRVNLHSPPTMFGYDYRDLIERHPRITLVVNANLTELIERADARAVTQANFVNFRKLRGTAAASYFVLALGGLETPRALLLSDRVTTGGIGNERGLVGRGLMDHPTVEAMVMYPNAAFQRAWRDGQVYVNGEPLRLSVEATEAMLRRHQLTNARMPPFKAPKMYTSEGIESAHQIVKAWGGDTELKSIFPHLWNVIKDADLVFEQWRRKRGEEPWLDRGEEYGGFPIMMMIEQMPEVENRIELTGERDALGLRKGRIVWRLGSEEKEQAERLVKLFARRLGAKGLAYVRSFLAMDDTGRRFDEHLNFGHHHMGTTRASDNPRNGVVDGNQRVHGRENLYIAGSSVFPTGSHVPPTTTIVATTIRLADHLKGRLAA